MTVIPGGFGQANFRMGGASLPTGGEITIGFDAGALSPPPADIAGDLIDLWVLHIDPLLPGSVTLNSVLVKLGPEATGPSAEVASGATGSGGGVSASSAVATLVHKVTALGGRAGRGRLFLPGVLESEVDPGGLLSPAALTAQQAAWDDFHAGMVAADLQPVLLHSETSPLSTPTPITSFRVDGRVGTQRRRQRR